MNNLNKIQCTCNFECLNFSQIVCLVHVQYFYDNSFKDLAINISVITRKIIAKTNFVQTIFSKTNATLTMILHHIMSPYRSFVTRKRNKKKNGTSASNIIFNDTINFTSTITHLTLLHEQKINWKIIWNKFHCTYSPTSYGKHQLECMENLSAIRIKSTNHACNKNDLNCRCCGLGCELQMRKWINHFYTIDTNT